MKIPNHEILAALRAWEQSPHTEESDFALCDAINELHEKTPNQTGTDSAYNEVIDDQKREIEDLTKSRDEVFHELEGYKEHNKQLKEETMLQQETLMHNESELISLRDEVTRFKTQKENFIQSFYAVGKTTQLRDLIITGSYAIGSDGMKEPIDWKKYAENLESHFINIVIK